MLAKLAKSGVADESGTVAETLGHLGKNVPLVTSDCFRFFFYGGGFRDRRPRLLNELRDGRIIFMGRKV